MRVQWKGFELPTKVRFDEGTATPTYAAFTAEPFQRGFATTLGNALRRALYSSIEGVAPTSVKIKGANQDSQTVKGVVEDVTEILLNIKGLIVTLGDDDAEKSLTIEASGKGPVTAAKIVAQDGVEIHNPDLHICTLADDVNFRAEVLVRKGRRYYTSEEQSKSGLDGGFVIDSSFSPVKRVRYKIENTRVGKLTDFERLVIEVWTDGSTSPETALSDASKILRKHFNPFVQYFEVGRELQINERKEEEERKREAENEKMRETLSLSISELDLSVRSANCLANEKIETIGELVGLSENDLLKFRNFGKTSLREVKKKVAEMNLNFGYDVDAVFGKKRGPVA